MPAALQPESEMHPVCLEAPMSLHRHSKPWRYSKFCRICTLIELPTGCCHIPVARGGELGYLTVSSSMGWYQAPVPWLILVLECLLDSLLALCSKVSVLEWEGTRMTNYCEKTPGNVPMSETVQSPPKCLLFLNCLYLNLHVCIFVWFWFLVWFVWDLFFVGVCLISPLFYFLPCPAD